jgi:[ribosomal protein S5]-alanine N-acetyltransferase
MNEVHLETARLLMRPFALRDLDVLHSLWTDPEVRRYLWDDEIISRETAREVIEGSIENFEQRGFGFWILSLKNDPQPIGFGGLRQFKLEKSGADEIEILYGLAPKYWGQGLATEAAQAFLRYGFEELGLENIYAGADPPNKASFRVMQRLGMNEPRHTEVNGLAAIYYSMRRAEFQPTASLYRLKSKNKIEQFSQSACHKLDS